MREALRESLPREVLPDDRPRTESLLFFCDLPCSPVTLEPLLLLEAVLFLEPEAEPLLELLLLEAPREDDPREDDDLAPEDLAPEVREELLLRALPLDFEGIEIPFLLSCAMKALAAQDAKHATKYPAILCVSTVCD